MCNFLSYFTSESTVAWFHSYLTSRQQSTKYCRITSDACSLHSDVLQGGVLSTTLFIVYLNNTLNLLDQGTAIAYEDDITVIGSGRTPSEAYDNIIQIITTIFTWADRYCLVLNFNKCQSMLQSPLTRKPFVTNTELFIPNASIPVLTLKEPRILGVTLNSNLKWTTQSSRVCKSASKMIGVLNRLRTLLNFTSRQRIFEAFILPKITYCLPVWSNTGKSAEKAMNVVLLHAARIVQHNKNVHLNTSTCTITGLLPFCTMSAIRCWSEANSLLSYSDCNNYLLPLMSTLGNTIIIRNISGQKFLLPSHKNTVLENSFHYNAAKLWNEIDYTVTEINDHKIFTSKIFKHFIRNLTQF